MFEAVLVALADHGFTPTAIAARLTYLSAPDSVQGALAAGLLGGGSRFLGVTEDTARFLAAALAEAGHQQPDGDADSGPGTGAAAAGSGARTPPPPDDGADWDAIALAAVRRARAAGRLIPGLGHPVHKVTDPRTPRLFGIARELVNTLFMATVGALALALGLSFGLGGRDTAAEIVRSWYTRSQQAAPKVAEAADAALDMAGLLPALRAGAAGAG